MLGFDNWLALFWGVAARIAVIGFFVISGWLMAFSAIKHTRENRFDSREYFANRFFRIFPPLAISVLVIILLQLLWAALRHPLPELRVENAFARPDISYDFLSVLNALLTVGLRGDLTGGINGPLWSLVFEIQLYCLVGLAAVLSKPTRRPIIFILLACGFGWYSGARPGTVNFICYVSFTAGFLAFYYSRVRFSWRLAEISWIGFVLALYLYVFVDSGAIMRIDNGMAAILQLCFAVGFSMSIAKFESNSMLAKWKCIGDMSYTLYIIHFPMLLVLSFILYTRFAPTFINLWLWWGTGTALVVFVSYHLARLGEQPKAQKAWILKQLTIYASNNA
jgi:peptidoglycan/LPS O-acetylase OafA/YrhL